MAADEVLVIVTAGVSPADYNTAHLCTDGDAFVVTAPNEGCSIQFNCTVKSVNPPIAPSANGVYSLAADQVANFLLEGPATGFQDVHFYVGPIGVASATGVVPDPGLNPAAHTVRVGSTGTGGS
jgi:hypothetical protein